MIATAVPFAALSSRLVHDLCRVRQDVFVVEQACPYPDLDGRDVEDGTRHVLLRESDDPGARLLGCARVLDDRTEWRVGRVLLLPEVRGRGLAEVLMTTALSVARGRDVVLEAQTPLAGWYETFGFAVEGPEFLDEGIPHVPMRLSL